MSTRGAPSCCGTAPRAGEAGSALIETLIAAVLLIAVSFGVINSLMTAAHGTAENKGRTVAATLAEQDQERMRAMSVSQLSNYHSTQTVTADGQPYAGTGAAYTVASRADWIRDDTGTMQSCTTTDSEPDYLRITSTATSNVVGADTQPVVVRSVVSPPVGSLGPGQGTFTVKVVDRDGNGLPGLNVTASGPSTAPRTYTDVTNDLGCAVFGYVPVGAYSGSVSAANYVDTDGNTTESATATVAEGKVATVKLTYDHPGTLSATLNAPAPRGGTAITVVQPRWTGTQTRRVTIPAGATTGSYAGLFPFASTSPYTVYAGSCDVENPNSNGATAPTAFFNPGATTSVDLRLPPATVTVKKGANPVTNANVKMTATGCTEAPVLTTDATGAATVNLPYGNFTVCADDGTVRKTGALSNRDTGSTATIDLASGTTSGKCP